MLGVFIMCTVFCTVSFCFWRYPVFYKYMLVTRLDVLDFRYDLRITLTLPSGSGPWKSSSSSSSSTVFLDM